MKILLLAYLATLAGSSINSMVNPVLPQLSTELGISKIQSSLLVVAVPVIGIITSPIIGILMDKYLLRRTVLSILLLGTGVAGGICAGMSNYYIFLVLRMIQGIGSNLMGMSFVLISEEYQESTTDRKKWLSINSGVMTIGLAICPVLGGALGELSWRYAYIPFTINIITAISCWFILPRDLCIDTDTKQQTSFKQRMLWLKESVLTVNGIAMYSITLIVFIMFFMVPLFSFSFIMKERLGSTSGIISGFLCLSASITAIMAYVYSYFAHKIHYTIILLIGLIGMSGSFLLLAFSNSYWLVAIAMIIYGFSDFMAMTPIHVHITELACVPEVKGSLSSFWVVVSRLGQIIGPLLAAYLQLNYSNAIVCIAAAGFGGMTALLFAITFISTILKSRRI